jgi:hypothetical protein
MEFPMNRQRLQDIRKEIEDDFVEKCIDYFVDNVSECILRHAYKTSSLPFEPPNYIHGSMYGHPKRQVKIDIQEQISMLCNFKQKYFNMVSFHEVIINSNKNIIKERLQVILNKLQTLFPDVSFQLDPLKTYILVDWS